MPERLRIFPVFWIRSSGQRMPVISWRRASVTTKGTVELRERLKAHLECNRADAKLGVDTQVFRLFESHATDVFQRGDLAEKISRLLAAVTGRSRLGKS